MGQSFSSLLKLRSFGLLFNVFQTDQINMRFCLVAFAVIAPFVSAGLLPDGSCHTTVYTALKGKLKDPEGNVIHFPNIGRPRFCRKKCLQNPDCEYFLLMKEGDWIGCWLKSSDAKIVQGKKNEHYLGSKCCGTKVPKKRRGKMVCRLPAETDEETEEVFEEHEKGDEVEDEADELFNEFLGSRAA